MLPNIIKFFGYVTFVFGFVQWFRYLIKNIKYGIFTDEMIAYCLVLDIGVLLVNLASLF